MASAIMHICVAKEINKILNLNEQDFFIGSIAPDLGKLINENKNKTHFIDSKNEFDQPNIEAFLKKYSIDKNNSYDMGYLVHLLTDKYYFRDYIPIYINNYIKKYNIQNLTYTDLKNIIYNDYTRINTNLVNHYELNIYFMYNEITYPSSQIEEIPTDKLYILINSISNILLNSYTLKPVILEENEIYKFIENVSKAIIQDLKNMELINEEK